eukprot:TRINITY_DN2499_c0_g2_i1.p1 TRINITY_DN2499_c0_g2~~TRINITY_DN2499_c0_g2_i1.p1  ORF type:complete len:626 (+),score=38.68 TRINITY_DN2499_c0_g2_i1:252-2129(+)
MPTTTTTRKARRCECGGAPLRGTARRDPSDDSETTCSARTRTAVVGPDNFKVQFDLPESPPGSVHMSCGAGTRSPDTPVEFVCNDQLEWEDPKETPCEKLVLCGRTSLSLNISDGSPDYRLHLEPTTILDGLPVEKSLPCPATSTHPSGQVHIQCLTSGKWELLSEECRHGPGSCRETRFNMKLGGSAHKYELPAMENGQVKKEQCQLGEMTEGTIDFVCQSGTWAYAQKNSCRIPGKCIGLEFDISMGDAKHTYELPVTAEGDTIARQCEFGEINEGEMFFTCENGEWNSKAKPNTCRYQGSCQETSLPVTLFDVTTTFSLPYVRNGRHAHRPCEFGDVVDGHVQFKCEDGTWKVAPPHSCRRPGACRATTFEMTLDGHAHKYELLAGDNGSVVSEQCQFGEITEGSIDFVCQSGKWHYANRNSCLIPGKCRGGKLTITMNDVEHTYKLPVDAEGKVISQPCLFGDVSEGEIFFKCEDREWNTKAQPNTCQRAIKPGACRKTRFTMTIGGESHEYVLDETDNQDVIQKNCSFGDLTEGTIDLACNEGSWIAKSNTCKVPGQVCSNTAFTVHDGGGQGNDVLFSLKASSEGEVTLLCPQGFGGSAVFECLSSGEWKYKSAACTLG